MAQFKFPLAPVKAVRQVEVDAKQRALQEALGEAQAVRAQYQAVEGRRRALDANNRAGPFDPRSAIMQGRYRALLDEQLAEIRAQLTTREAAVLAAREALTLAQQGLESLDQLEARQRAEWVTERQRRERSSLDELAVLRAGRR